MIDILCIGYLIYPLVFMSTFNPFYIIRPVFTHSFLLSIDSLAESDLCCIWSLIFLILFLIFPGEHLDFALFHTLLLWALSVMYCELYLGYFILFILLHVSFQYKK